jgi:hypothetical protein
VDNYDDDISAAEDAFRANEDPTKRPALRAQWDAAKAAKEDYRVAMENPSAALLAACKRLASVYVNHYGIERLNKAKAEGN